MTKLIDCAWDNLALAVNAKDIKGVKSSLTALEERLLLEHQQKLLNEQIAKHVSGSKEPEEPDAFEIALASYKPKREANRPRMIEVGDQKQGISYSYEITTATAEWILKHSNKLPAMYFVRPTAQGFSKTAKLKQLSNGSFIEIGDDQPTLIAKARKLLDAAGYTHQMAAVTFNDGTAPRITRSRTACFGTAPPLCSEA